MKFTFESGSCVIALPAGLTLASPAPSVQRKRAHVGDGSMGVPKSTVRLVPETTRRSGGTVHCAPRCSCTEDERRHIAADLVLDKTRRVGCSASLSGGCELYYVPSYWRHGEGDLSALGR